jgi:hypothetical protein
VGSLEIELCNDVTDLILSLRLSRVASQSRRLTVCVGSVRVAENTSQVVRCSESVSKVEVLEVAALDDWVDDSAVDSRCGFLPLLFLVLNNHDISGDCKSEKRDSTVRWLREKGD